MRLTFTDDIYYFLEFASRDSVIAQILLDGGNTHIKNEGNYLDMSDSEHLSYLPASKFEKTEEVWKKNRTKIKVGRFIRKFFTEFSVINFSINDKSIERFVNLYKSYFSKDESKLMIVEGEDIKKYYLQENYHISNGQARGSLWNSCMRQSERNKFLSLYEKNKSAVKMLVYLSDDNKVRARALLWQDVKDYNNPESSYKFMDRIYYVYDHDIQFFKDWADKNGYITKLEQNAKSERLFLVNNTPVKLLLHVDLDIHNLPYAPYLDTFKYYNYYKGRFSNTDSKPYQYILVQSDGSYEKEPEPEEYDDEN